MILKTFSIKNPFRVHLLSFVLGAIIVNIVALVSIPWLAVMLVGQAFSFFYILLTPGLFLLPFLTHKKLPFALGISISVALSIFSLMIAGLLINTILPLLGMLKPLSTIPLIIIFDVLIFILFILNDIYRSHFAIQTPNYSLKSWSIIIFSSLSPILACIGALSLNNGGSNIITMVGLGLIFLSVPILFVFKNHVDESVPPITLFLAALSLLLMNSMRGWFITGHDILLEYHVFTLTNTAHLWNMAIFRDPYNACLSITILPTYLQNILHISDAYIFKLLFQFLGATPVVIIYYLSKQYVSSAISFLAAFLFISFPSFVVDMAFLNRQGVGFLFFAAMLTALLSTEFFQGRARKIALFVFGTGIILSHYSTSYVAIALLIGAYVVNRIIRFIFSREKPQYLLRITNKFGNKEIYTESILLNLSFVLGMLAILILWSVIITKTSTSLLNTLNQIITTIEHPFSVDDYSGPAKYSLLQSTQQTPAQLFDQFSKKTIKSARIPENESNLYPLSLAQQYPAFPVAPVNEPPIPVTSIGKILQANLHFNLANFYYLIKQIYAKIIQIFLLIGFISLGLGYSFKKKVLKNVPAEFIALSVTGVGIMFAQVVLPASNIDYGLYRLFQQNLIFLTLPITLAFLAFISLLVRNYRVQLFVHMSILLSCFLIFSGFIPQITGGGRPPLPLDNYGFYYDAYYTHAEEVSSIKWLSERNSKFPIQSDHYFSSVKILAYGNKGTITGLLSETIQKDSYIYLNYNNIKTGNVIEFIGNSVFYYHLSTDFLKKEKNLIYNNGGSEIYR